MIKFFFAFLFLSAGCACMAQDRIHTKDGRVIECKVSDSSNRAGNVFFFPADDPETSHFIPVTQVDYLEIGDERVVRTPNDKLKPAETRFGLKAPALPHMLGATYDFLSNTYVHTHGATVSYAYFLTAGTAFMPSWPIAVWRVLPLPKEELIRAPQSIFSR